jgi:hypothetical protein
MAEGWLGKITEQWRLGNLPMGKLLQRLWTKKGYCAVRSCFPRSEVKARVLYGVVTREKKYLWANRQGTGVWQMCMVVKKSNEEVAPRRGVGMVEDQVFLWQDQANRWCPLLLQKVHL